MRTAMMLTMVDVKNCVGLHPASQLLVCLLNFDAIRQCKNAQSLRKISTTKISRIVEPSADRHKQKHINTAYLHQPVGSA